ncbi:transcriptional regulator [Streptomyces sp. NBC_01014]|uniref:transcriptional regulator n=1 Tax=Streptomyces sp. NBC_01014 TaxID=2903719 RepID=UPI0038689006|nr:transcriptional regulator [Streptomyces sp. NBC_01014]
MSRWEIGTRSPREWLPFLAQVLQVPREMLEMAKAVQPVESAPSVRSVADFLSEGDPLAPLRARTGRRIGAGQVADLAQRVHGLRLADDVVYGKDLIGPALRELQAAVKLYREGVHTEEVGRELLRAIGELAQIAGWVASDAGEHAEAERIYRLGMSAAQAARDGVLSGNVAGSLAYQWSNTGRTADAVGLARAALKDAGPDAPAKARALYLDRVAWAHTRAGQDRLAMTALGEAAEALSEDSAGTESPSYLYWMDAGELQVMEARVYTELRRPLRAVPLLTDVLGRYDASHARELALYLSWLAVAYADANEPEAAAGTAGRMLALGQSGSERTAERTRIVLDRLRACRAVPEVAELLAS